MKKIADILTFELEAADFDVQSGIQTRIPCSLDSIHHFDCNMAYYSGIFPQRICQSTETRRYVFQ